MEIKMKKKIIASLLAIVMLFMTLALASCNGLVTPPNGDPGNNGNNGNTDPDSGKNPEVTLDKALELFNNSPKAFFELLSEESISGDAAAIEEALLALELEAEIGDAKNTDESVKLTVKDGSMTVADKNNGTYDAFSGYHFGENGVLAFFSPANGNEATNITFPSPYVDESVSGAVGGLFALEDIFYAMELPALTADDVTVGDDGWFNISESRLKEYLRTAIMYFVMMSSPQYGEPDGTPDFIVDGEENFEAVEGVSAELLTEVGEGDVPDFDISIDGEGVNVEEEIGMRVNSILDSFTLGLAFRIDGEKIDGARINAELSEQFFIFTVGDDNMLPFGSVSVSLEETVGETNSLKLLCTLDMAELDDITASIEATSSVKESAGSLTVSAKVENIPNEVCTLDLVVDASLKYDISDITAASKDILDFNFDMHLENVEPLSDEYKDTAAGYAETKYIINASLKNDADGVGNIAFGVESHDFKNSATGTVRYSDATLPDAMNDYKKVINNYDALSEYSAALAVGMSDYIMNGGAADVPTEELLNMCLVSKIDESVFGVEITVVVAIEDICYGIGLGSDDINYYVGNYVVEAPYYLATFGENGEFIYTLVTSEV